MLKLKLIILFILISQTDIKSQIFDVKFDTLNINIKKIVKPASKIDLTHAVKFDNNYYCFIEERGLYRFKKETKYFVIFSNKGEILHNIEVPEEIQNTVYYDLFIRNNNLYAKTYMDHDSFVFNLNELKWQKIEELDDRVFEDQNYIIKYLDLGEWGETTWFVDKESNEEYELGFDGTTINKLNGTYYLTNHRSIREVKDPKKLQKTIKGNYYRNVEKDKKHFEGSTSLVGSKIIYNDSTYPSFDFEKPKQKISTSFVSNNLLFQLYSDEDSTFIGRIDKKRMIPVQTIGNKYRTYDWHYSYRGKNIDNIKRFIKFNNDKNFGFIDIDNEAISITYLKHNNDSLPYLGSDGFEVLLTKILASDYITREDIYTLEKSIGGIDMRDYKTSTSHNGYYPKKYNNEHVNTISYIKIQDSSIAQVTEYLDHNESKNIKSIFFEWSPTQPYNQKELINFSFGNKTKNSPEFKNKLIEIRKIITKFTKQAPVEEITGKNSYTLTWLINEQFEIKLFGKLNYEGRKDIRMIINML